MPLDETLETSKNYVRGSAENVKEQVVSGNELKNLEGKIINDEGRNSNNVGRDQDIIYSEYAEFNIIKENIKEKEDELNEEGDSGSSMPDETLDTGLNEKPLPLSQRLDNELKNLEGAVINGEGIEPNDVNRDPNEQDAPFNEIRKYIKEQLEDNLNVANKTLSIERSEINAGNQDLDLGR